jgi:hypothetical protein
MAQRHGARSGRESAIGTVGGVVGELVGASLCRVMAGVVGVEIGTEIGQGGDSGDRDGSAAVGALIQEQEGLGRAQVGPEPPPALAVGSRVGDDQQVTRTAP